MTFLVEMRSEIGRSQRVSQFYTLMNHHLIFKSRKKTTKFLFQYFFNQIRGVEYVNMNHLVFLC